MMPKPGSTFVSCFSTARVAVRVDTPPVADDQAHDDHHADVRPQGPGDGGGGGVGREDAVDGHQRDRQRQADGDPGETRGPGHDEHQRDEQHEADLDEDGDAGDQAQE
ncbi:hypothetical protein GCM10010980_15670 [Corynebacterium marinum]|nr:hypothetical protein GCM10010980_15670 [Corynebacterium marinum]